jgi:hypothetical protein
MTARELDEAAGAVRGFGRRARDSAVAATIAAALAPASSLVSGVLAISVGVGAAALALRTILVIARRRLLVERLSLEPDAQAIDEVRCFAERLASPPGRAELARDIRSMLHDAVRPASRMRCLFLVDRVIAYARELDSIARDLLSPAICVDLVSVARCRWLLTEAADNPLYDRHVPEADLGVILHRIRAGMQAVPA